MNKGFLLKDVEIVPRVIPQHTYLLIKCLGLQFAQDFINRGAMRFGCPQEWSKPDGTSRFDPLEGVYASQRGFDPLWDKFLKKQRRDVTTFKKKGFTFYRSDEITSYRTYCLYGASSNTITMRDKRSQDHQFHQAGVVSKSYFHKLYPKVTKSNIETLSQKDKPAVLFLRPDYFVSFVKAKLMEKGVKEEEIFISPISYSDYFRKPFFIANDPEELFSKRVSFVGQNEVRIVVSTRRKEVRSLFNEDGVIELGAVDRSIVTLNEFYFQDMSLEIRGDKLLYSMPNPEVFDYVDSVSLIIVMQQALSDELPQAPMGIDEIKEYVETIIKTLQLRDPNTTYDWRTNILRFEGQFFDLGAKAGYKILEHYNNYLIDKDYRGAGDAIKKFKYFFPKYDMGGYFDAYYDWLNSNREH